MWINVYGDAAELMQCGRGLSEGGSADHERPGPTVTETLGEFIATRREAANQRLFGPPPDPDPAADDAAGDGAE